MFFQQIIALELRVPGPPGRMCTRATGKFHGKAKISEKYFQVDYFIIYS